MHKAVTALAALLVVLAGCTTPLGGGTETAAPTDTAVPTTETDATDTTPTTTPDDETTPTPTGPGDNGSTMVENPPDPETDVLGWEAGLWHNETIAVNNTDGMNASERKLAVARAMARVEYVRQLEFDGNETIPIDVITRAEYQNRTSQDRNYTDAYRTFDNVKFEAMLFVGEDRDSLAVQNQNRGSSVLGYYSPANKSIVLISEGDLPQFSGEETLAQEVAHALQDQRFNISKLRGNVTTRDEYNGQNGLVEGDGNLIDQLYVERCGAEWDCIPAPPGDAGGGDLGEDFHFGIYFLEFLPYSDGPGFIRHYFDRGGWDRIDRMYESPPNTAEQIIYPEKYGSDPPTEVTIDDRTGDGWERVRPESQRPGAKQPAYDRLGQSALSSMFMYTNYDSYNQSRAVSPFEFLNIENGQVNSSDPLNYGFEFTDGWEGDRIQIYEHAETGDDGYVWRIQWESTTDATEFVDAYGDLLSHWGGERVGETRWVLRQDSPFADAFSVTVDGDTVTIVNAPTRDQLGDVYAPAGQ